MKIFEAKAKDLPPVGVLILLTAIFPGAGHLAVKQNVKGWMFIGVSVILFIAFFIYIGDIIAPVSSALMAGREPEINDEFMENVKAIGYILGGGLLVWLAALVDVIIIGKRINASGGKG